MSSRAEKKVGEKLTQKGIENYVPLKKEKKQWSDRKKTVFTPLINGYVFVKPDEKQRDEVLMASGVVQYVRYNKADAIIRDIEIAALKSIEEKGYFVEGNFESKIKIGEMALIKYGPFKGIRGRVKKTVSEEEYYLAIEGIDYCLTIKVPAEVLVKT